MTPIEVYGEVAKRLTSPTLISGRYLIQAAQEVQIGPDVAAKLGLSGKGRLLEIGCGVGTTLNYLAGRVLVAIGIDHVDCIAQYRKFGHPPNVILMSGEWPNVQIDEPVDRVVAYSVLHYLPDEETARTFIQACLAVLCPGGGLLIGDLPNSDKRRRFLDSDFGKRFDAEWKERHAEHENALDAEIANRDKLFEKLGRCGQFIADSFILGVMEEARREGHESYLLPQPSELPFGFTREDLVIWKAGRP